MADMKPGIDYEKLKGYAKEHPEVVVLFVVAALAHVIYHRGIIPKKRA